MLVPCFNAERYIEGFLDNIAKLNLPFDEVIFYDDASTDNTAGILISKGLKVIKGGINRGAGYARNILAAATTCNWFHFHDIDDRLVPDYLTRAAAIAMEDTADVVLCNVDWYEETETNMLMRWHYANDQIRLNPLAYTIANPIGGINGLYKKEAFVKAGGFNTEYRIWEDADLHVKLAGSGARFHVIEETLSYALRYANSLSNDQLAGWLHRLSFLKQYAAKYSQFAVQQAIGKEAQITASKLILMSENAAAKEALKLSEACGLKVPNSNNIGWQILKSTAPAKFRIPLRMWQLKRAFKK